MKFQCMTLLLAALPLFFQVQAFSGAPRHHQVLTSGSKSSTTTLFLHDAHHSASALRRTRQFPPLEKNNHRNEHVTSGVVTDDRVVTVRRHGATTSTTLYQSSSAKRAEKTTSQPSTNTISFNSIPAKAWLLFLSWAFFFAPGSVGDAADVTLLVEPLLASATQFVSPDTHQLFYTVFNLFIPMPLIMAALLLPQVAAAKKENYPTASSKYQLPVTPTLFLCSAIGFVALGPYLALRPTVRQVESVGLTRQDLGWFTRTVLENKVFAGSLVLLSVAVVLCTNAWQAFQANPTAVIQDFVDLLQTSNLVAVSTVDISILYATIIALTPTDYLLRKPTASKSEAYAVAAATALLPFVGSSLYIALRPSLPEDDSL